MISRRHHFSTDMLRLSATPPFFGRMPQHPSRGTWSAQNGTVQIDLANATTQAAECRSIAGLFGDNYSFS